MRSPQFLFSRELGWIRRTNRLCGEIALPSVCERTVKGLTVFRFFWTGFVVMVTSAPYLCNAASAPPGSHYTWIIPPCPDDLLAYAAWAQQAAHGAWLFKLKFTALPHHGFFFNPFFLICGWLAAF